MLRESRCVTVALRMAAGQMITAIVSNPFARLSLRAEVDILIIATLIYYMLQLLRGTRAMQMLIAILLLVILYEGARRAQFEMVEWLLDTLLPYVAIALIVLFQPEIRRALDRFLDRAAALRAVDADVAALPLA